MNRVGMLGCDFDDGADFGGNHWEIGLHGFQKNAGQSLASGRNDKKVQRIVDGCHILAKTGEYHAFAEAEGGCLRLESRLIVAFANDHACDGDTLSLEEGQAVEKYIDPLFAAEPADDTDNGRPFVAPAMEDGRKLKEAIGKYSAAGEKLDSIATRADRILAKLEAGEGTLGATLKDKQVYDDLKSLLADLRKHPWKMLWKD